MNEMRVGVNSYTPTQLITMILNLNLVLKIKLTCSHEINKLIDLLKKEVQIHHCMNYFSFLNNQLHTPIAMNEASTIKQLTYL